MWKPIQNKNVFTIPIQMFIRSKYQTYFKIIKYFNV